MALIWELIALTVVCIAMGVGWAWTWVVMRGDVHSLQVANSSSHALLKSKSKCLMKEESEVRRLSMRVNDLQCRHDLLCRILDGSVHLNDLKEIKDV